MLHPVPQLILLQNTNGVNFYNILTQKLRWDEDRFRSKQWISLWETQHKLKLSLLHKCFGYHFFFYRLTEASPHSPFAPSVPFQSWWMGQSDRSLVSYQRMSHGEVIVLNDLHRYLCNLWHFMIIQVFSCFFRTSWGSVWNHGRRFHEACGRHCRSAFGCRGQCYHLQWPAGSHCGHNGWGCEPFQNGNSWPTHFRL